MARFSELIKRKEIQIKSVNIEVDKLGTKIYHFSLASKNMLLKNEFMNEVYLLDVHTIKEEKDEFEED